jgi:membrane-associated protease RseP (regulator of RpoE activity)
MKRFAILIVTMLALGMRAFADVEAPPPAPPAPDGDLEQRLEAARQRLDEAARTVAELTAEQVWSNAATRHRRAALGVVLAPSEKGLVVAGVTPGSGAAKAGLEPGDVIVSINGVAVERPESRKHLPKTLDLLGDVEPGETVRVEYERNGARASVDVTTREHPAFAFAGVGVGEAGAFDEPPTIEFFDGPPPFPPDAPMPPDARMPPDAPEPMFFTKRLHGGLALHDLDDKLGRYFGVTEGVLVLSAPESEQGLEPGDVVKSVAGTAVKTARETYRALAAADEDVAVEVLRDGGTATVQVKPLSHRGAWYTPGARVHGIRVIRATDDPAPGSDANVDVILRRE